MSFVRTVIDDRDALPSFAVDSRGLDELGRSTVQCGRVIVNWYNNSPGREFWDGGWLLSVSRED